MHRRTATFALACYVLTVFVLPAVHHLQHQRAGEQTACCNAHLHSSPRAERPACSESADGRSVDGRASAQLAVPSSAEHSEHACAICQALQAKPLAAIAAAATADGDTQEPSHAIECGVAARSILGLAAPRGPPADFS